MLKVLRILLIIFVAIFVIIQFFRIDKTNPEADMSKDFIQITKPPEEVALMIKNACYDCHSHHTKYPWYTDLAPFSWLIKQHIDIGRQNVNFSLWSDYPAGKANHKIEECFEEIEKGAMPMAAYLPMHPEAKFTPEQRQKLVDWFKSKYEGEEQGQ